MQPMIYEVKYFDPDGHHTGSDMAARDFSQAKQLAEHAVLAGIAARAEVRSATGSLLFHRPRTLRT